MRLMIMAITSLQYLFQLKSEEIGFTMKAHKPVEPSQTLPLYIPRLMPHIKSGTPKTTPTNSMGSLVFLNAPEILPIALPILTTQNYLEPKFERNKSFGKDQLNADEMIPRKTKLAIHCKTNVISQMTFSNDIIE